MASLKVLLDSILSRSRFDLGHEALSGGRLSRSYASRADEVTSPEGLRQLLEGARATRQNASVVRAARLICDGDLISPLHDCLRYALDDFVDPASDRIGHAFPKMGLEAGDEKSQFEANGLCIDSCVTPVSNFSRAIVKGSALVGSERVVSLLDGWVKGEPIRYRSCAILNGITVKQSVAPLDSISIEVLPFSTDNLPVGLSQNVSVSAEHYLGRTVVAINAAASPALFRPGGEQMDDVVTAATDSSVGMDVVCQTLSLVSNDLVDVEFYWLDYLDLATIFGSRSTTIWYGPSGRLNSQLQQGRRLSRDLETDVLTLLVDDQSAFDLADAGIGEKMESLARTDFAAVRIATSRWMKSKNSRDGLVDQFVDLRMALEALYLKDFTNERSQEMRFRLALFGAWFLGENLQDRKRIRIALRNAYDRASGAVHTGNIDYNEENRGVLAEAQELCRQGVLKLLKEGYPADWGDLVLGAQGSNS